MASEKDQILADLDRLRAGFRERFAAAKTEQALRDENAKIILGKNGSLALTRRDCFPPRVLRTLTSLRSSPSARTQRGRRPPAPPSVSNA